jgi:DNA-binding MarR family transcriptional regulator
MDQPRPLVDDRSALAGDLGWSLGTVFRRYLDASRIALADVPGGPRGFQVLAAVARDQAGTQLALARHLGIDRTVMTYLLDDLERAGLVQRVPDPQDRRARRVRATAAGEVLLADLVERRAQVEADLLSGLPDAEREALRSTLGWLALRLDSSASAGGACAAAEELDGGGPCAC